MKKIVFAAIAIAVVSALGAQAVGQNLISNGDFEAGNTGFTSEYTYVEAVYQNSLEPPSVYAIGINPNLYHSSWDTFADHTTGDTENLMMIVNADATYPDSPLPQSPKVVWGQEVTLTECTPTYPVTTETLWAGNGAWEAGEVQVKTSEDGICVKFVLTDAAAIAEGWLITEAHVAVGADPSDIPQKNNNPIPGQFPISEKLDPGVTETEWYCLDYAWSDGVPIVVAAHAKLELAEEGEIVSYEFCMTSGADTQLALGYADVASYNPWGSVDENVNNIPDCPCSAEWIWDADVATGYYADNGGMVDFEQSFDIMGSPTSATFKIAADNAFAWSLNGGTETAENLADGWRTEADSGNFDWPGVVIDPYQSGWSMVYNYNVLGSLSSGTNTLNVTGVNADWDTDSWSDNPGAVIYKLCGTSEEYVVTRPYDSETGWGDGDNFLGKNWATYITYTPEVVCDYGSYLLEFYAASSYDTAPAQLEVKINNVVVPPTLALTSTSGQWVKYSATWAAGAVDYANIEIRDLRYKFNGDDFVIDDISLEQQ